MTQNVDRKDHHVGCFNPFDRIEDKESEEEEEQPDGPYPDHCTCQKNECRKGYCKCFYQGKGCDPTKCKCINCKNMNDNPETIEKRKQLQLLKENISAGCSCQKNKCTKKYCVCRLRGVACTAKCRCVDCGNNHEGNELCPETLKDETS